MCNVKIPMTIGQFHIVECDIPLLVSKNDLRNWQAKHDHHSETLTMGMTGDKVKLKTTKSRHVAIPLDEDEKKIKVYAVIKETTRREGKD